MSEAAPKPKLNMVYITGILIFCFGMMFSNIGPGMAIPSVLASMDSMSYYPLISALGTVGMMLVLPMAGKLYGIFGMRKIMLLGVGLQLAARIGCMIVTTIVPLMVMYLFSAIGAGCLMASPYIMMAGAVAPEVRAKYYGFIATFNAIGMLTGPVICGWLTDIGLGLFSFIAYIPFVLIALFLMFGAIPNQKQPDAAKGFDFLSVLLLVATVVCIVLWLNLAGKDFGWASVPSILMIVAGIVALILLLRRALTIPNPSVPLGMLRKKRLRTAFIGALAATAYSTCSAAYVIVYIQTVLVGGSATLSGTAMMPQTIGTAILGVVLGGYLGKNFIKRFPPMGILSLVCVTVASAILFLLTPQSSMIQIWIATAIGGVAMAISQSGFPAFFQTELKPEEIPSAQAMYSFGSTGGSAFFGAFAGILMNLGGTLNHVYLMSAVICAIGLIVGITGFRFSKEEIAAAEATAAAN